MRRDRRRAPSAQRSRLGHHAVRDILRAYPIEHHGDNKRCFRRTSKLRLSCLHFNLGLCLPLKAQVSVLSNGGRTREGAVGGTLVGQQQGAESH